MIIQGKVCAVDERPAGDRVMADYTAGATVLQLADATDFSEAGGRVEINGDVYNYTKVVKATNVMTLATGLIGVASNETGVYVYPYSYEKTAMVQTDSGTDSVFAIVPHALYDRLTVGIRSYNMMETVEIAVDRGSWKIKDIIGLQPVIDGTYIDGETIVGGTLAPSAPTGLTGISSVFADATGRPRAEITLTWVDPTTNTNGSALNDFKEVRVFKRVDSGGAPWVAAGTVLSGVQTALVTSFDPGVYYRFAVAAVDNSLNWSALSAEYRVQMGTDTTPPPVPSTPTVSVKLGTASIYWDGKNNAAGAMPLELSHVEVHVSASTGFTPDATTYKDRLLAAGVYVHTGAAYGTPLYTKLVAVDYSGNKSAGSGQATFTVTALVPTDLSVGVAGSKITPSATAPASPTTNDTWIDTANGNLIKIWDGDSWEPFADTNVITADRIAANTIAASMIAAGAVVASKIAADAIEAQHVKANAITGEKIAAGSISTEKLQLGVLRTNLVTDGSFEESYAFTNYDPFGFGPGGVWTQGNRDQWRWDYGASTTNPNTSLTRSVGVGRSRSGRAGASLYAQGSQETSIYSPCISVTVGKTYRLTIHAAALTNTVQMVTQMFTNSTTNITPFSTGVTLVGDQSTWSNLSPVAEPLSAASFTEFSWTFTATDVWIMMRIITWAMSGDRTLVLDDVSIVEVGVGGSTEVTAAGVRIFDDEGYEETAMVAGRPNIISVSDHGTLLASIDETGQGSFAKVSSREDIIVLGKNIVGSALGELVPGNASPFQKSLIEALPLGLVQHGEIATDSPNVTVDGAAGRKGVIEIAAPIFHNRIYKLCTSALRLRSSATDTWVELPIFITTGAAGDVTSWPTTPLVASSPELYRHPLTKPTITPGGTPATISWLWKPDPGSVKDHSFAYNARLLLAIERNSAGDSGTVYIDGTTGDVIQFWLEDLGPARANGGQANPGDGTVTVVPARTTVKTYTSTSWKTYKGDGTERTEDVTGPRQGYSSANGDQKGLWIFPNMSGDLTGATITRVRAFITNENWSGSSGTTIFKVHNYSTAPASSPTLVASSSHTNWGEGVGKWVELANTGGLYAGLIAGTVKGIAVGPAGTEDRLYTGKFGPVAQIEISFTK